MAQYSENKYLQSLLENLTGSYETEINYTPVEIELDSQQIAPEDLNNLIRFVTEPRKRLFIFKIHDDEQATQKLGFIARRSVLNRTAETILQSTSSEPKIYPLKKALRDHSSSIRARIQIQKSFLLPKPPSILQETHQELKEHIAKPDVILIPLDLPDLPELTKQLKALKVQHVQDSALLLIKNYSYAFKDGIIPSNLPKGFYINKEKQALCYTDTPRKFPSALAPILHKQPLLTVPSLEQITALLPDMKPSVISLLMETKYSLAQKNALMSLFPKYENEFKTLVQLLKPTEGLAGSASPVEFIIPLLCHQFIYGGEAHIILLVRLLNACLNKKISLEFLRNTAGHHSLLSTRGIKNLQKLVHLPAEQKEWWNTLVTAHLSYDKDSFDFNVFFEGYTQVFLPKIAEKNLTLPNPCPIVHNGHLLVTLNRVLDVIEHSENPQEQCLSLSQLNWGSTGVHYAMTQQTESEKLKHVASCMKISNPEDTMTHPELIYQKMVKEPIDLKPWLFRYMGQHWKKEIRLTEIQAQLLEVEKLTSWSPIQKNQLMFILTCTYADKTIINYEQWKKTLNSCINSLQELGQSDRSDLLQEISRCFRFKPNPSFTQVNTLITQCIEFKAAFPDKNFKNDFIIPLSSCLENEGFELINTLQERCQKTDPTPEKSQFHLLIIANFTAMLEKNRHRLSTDIIKILAKLNDSDVTQTNMDHLLLAFQNLLKTKGEQFHKVVLSILSQINISKSQSLPKVEQIYTLVDILAKSSNNLPDECKTLEKQEAWLKDLILDKSLLPGCVLGNGDISKLDDLIVDALVDSVKKRSAAFKVDTLKTTLQKNLQNFIVPQSLRDQLNRELIPLLDAVNDLVNLLQTPNPKFPEVIERLRIFEEKKPILLDGTYGVGLLGKTKGEYILSFLLTGKRKATDNLTGAPFAAILGQLHGLFVSEMKEFFSNPQNKLIVKDLDITTSLSWMAAFNETHSLTFFFKEELVQKKILPALKKTLQQLNTQDMDFEKSILDEAALLVENEPADESLERYKIKIESIANYLNLLIDINDRLPAQFIKIYKQLNTGALARLNYSQKQILIHKLIKDKSEDLDLYLKLTTQALEENLHAGDAAIERAINGLIDLFKLSDLEPETQVMFFKMSLTHNLKSTSPFPLAALNDLKKSNLPEATKSLIIKQIIQILIGLSGPDATELVHSLVHQTQLFLTHNQNEAELCIALLNRLSKENPYQDLSAYPLILQQLTHIDPQNRAKIAIILTNLANSKKDDTVNLFALLEVTKGLGRRSSVDINQVLKLFATHPFPNTQSLNSALLAHDSEKLQSYCLNFDTNPFAKQGEERDLTKQFTTTRVKEALLSLHDLTLEADLPHSLQMKLAKQLTYIETLGYTDPLKPNDFKALKKLTASSRDELKEQAQKLLQQLRTHSVTPEHLEASQLELIAYLREIYFRTTGLFPNSTQILVLLLALHDPSSNLLMRIKTGEGKSINTPMLSVLQWAQGGTVDQCTANPTLLIRDFQNNCDPFFKFLGIKTSLIQSHSPSTVYQLDGINCSTVEDMSIFRLAAKEAKKEKLLDNGGPIHVVLDECDDALLDQITLYKLVAETDTSQNAENNHAQWIYPLAYQFVNLPAFRNIDPTQGKIWDEEEDLEQFRLFLNKEINIQFSGSIEKQNYLMASSNTQLKQWLHASCMAATLVENKHFIIQPIKEKDEAGHEVTKKIICVPLIRSTPKTGSIFTEAVQQALQARLKAERKEKAQFFAIDAVPSVLSSQSARGLIKFYEQTKGRLLGISATPGDKRELESLATSLGTQAISIAPYAGDKRKTHKPIFTLNREESFKAIHTTIDTIKCTITKPTVEINPDAAIQTYEEREALIKQTKRAIEKWSHSQTQPILIINEDFDEAHALGISLSIYKEQGFKVQVITGKENPNELERIIKQAGQVNTITIGTAMLAKGIDINTGDHPKGLFVIQTYPDTERMTTQIAGRAARNGKPGEWLPIYKTQPPKNLLEKIFYYMFPWQRQRINERTVENLKNKIKLQATLDRCYNQAVDEVQQTLMQQIEAWESLLLELYPNDPKIQFDFYLWRETLLSELTRSQETSISESTLAESISHFKNSACKLWEAAKEEKWAAKAEKAVSLSSEHNIRLKYLKQLDLAQELNIQAPLQRKNKQFTAATKALMQQNLETVIVDKAGAFLDYSKPTGQLKKDLELAQAQQTLPHLIGEFCTVCPEAMVTLFPKTPKNLFFVPEIIMTFVNKIIEQKNRVFHKKEEQELTTNIIQYYQKKLVDADSTKIQVILSQMKPLILNHCKNLTHTSLVDQFKMQGLVLTFCTLYNNSGLPEDTGLAQLKSSYTDKIMKKLAYYLLEEFDWVNEVPEPFHAFFERSIAKDAAIVLSQLANDLIHAPQDKDKIQALYTALQEHQTLLRDKYLFSIKHISPRKVINDALAALDSLNNAPHCDPNFRNNCHDKVVSEYQLSAFRKYLASTSPYFFRTYDPTWDHLKNTLLKISYQSKTNPSHVVHELYESIRRFSTYEAYKPYTQKLNAMKKRLLRSIHELNKANGLHQDAQESLLAQKTLQFATLFKVAPEQIRIQKANDGIESFIELQIENAPLQEGFTGYQSSFLSRIETERGELKKMKYAFEENKTCLLDLSDKAAITSVPRSQRSDFEKLFNLKALLDHDWSQYPIDHTELPESIQKRMSHVDEMKRWNWIIHPVDLSKLCAYLGKEPDTHFTDMMDKHTAITKKLEEIQSRIESAEKQIRNQQHEITTLENTIKATQDRRQQSDCSFSESAYLFTQVLYTQSRVHYSKKQLAEFYKTLADINKEKNECLTELKTHNQSIDTLRLEFISSLLGQIKQELSDYLENTCTDKVTLIEKELLAAEPVIDSLEQSEQKKSRYQTRRFFKSRDLLHYEASLLKEVNLIPKKSPHKNLHSTLPDRNSFEEIGLELGEVTL